VLQNAVRTRQLVGGSCTQKGGNQEAGVAPELSITDSELAKTAPRNPCRSTHDRRMVRRIHEGRLLMNMRDNIIETLSCEPEEDWRGRIQGEAWYEDMLYDALVPTPEGYYERENGGHGPLTDADDKHDQVAGEFREALESLIREGKVRRSYVFNPNVDPATGEEYNVGRDYFVWLKTADKAEFTDRVEALDRQTVEMLRSVSPSYGESFAFGHDAEVLERM
jgi:hypothetical protein